MIAQDAGLQLGRLLPRRAAGDARSTAKSWACLRWSTTSPSSTTRSCSTRPASPTRPRDWTWTDFRDAAQKLTDAAAKQFGWAYVNDGSEDTVWRFLALLWQAGGDLLTTDNTKAAFNSPAGLKAMTLLRDMAVTDKSVYLDSGNGNYLNLFNAGKIAMLWTGPWDISSINKDVDFGVEILPGDMTHATIAGPDNYVVHRQRRRSACRDAWDFIDWFTSAEEHLKYATRPATCRSASPRRNCRPTRTT